MDCVARRTRSRRALSEGAWLEGSPSLRGHGAAARSSGSSSAGGGREGAGVSDSPDGLGFDERSETSVGAPAPQVIVLDDDGDEDDGGRGVDGDCKKGASLQGNRGHRSSRKSAYADEAVELGAWPRPPGLRNGGESWSSSDRKAVIAVSDLKGDDSEATVEDRTRSKSGSNDVKSASWSGSDAASGGLNACEHEGREGEMLEVNVAERKSEDKEACDGGGEKEIHKIADSNGEVEVLETNDANVEEKDQELMVDEGETHEVHKHDVKFGVQESEQTGKQGVSLNLADANRERKDQEFEIADGKTHEVCEPNVEFRAQESQQTGKEGGSHNLAFANGERKDQDVEVDEGKTHEVHEPNVEFEVEECRESGRKDGSNILADAEGQVDVLEINDVDEEEDAEVGSDKRSAQEVRYFVTTSCVARRTRSRMGKQRRVSYTQYFKVELSDDSEDEEDEEEEEAEDDSCYESDYADPENTRIMSGGGQKGCGEDGQNYKVKPDVRSFSGEDGSIAVAHHAQSCFDSEPCNKKQKVGFASNLDESKENFGFSSGMDCGKGSCRRNQVKSGGGGSKIDVDGREWGSRREGPQLGKTKKRKRLRALKSCSLFNLLVDTICNDLDKLPENLVSSKEKSSLSNVKPSCNKDIFPCIFSFADEDGKPVEKSDFENALDELWADFEFALESNNIGTYNNDEGQIEVDIPEDESDLLTLCSKGKHQFILDEQIGTRCKFCSFVNLEIKYIIPSLATHIWEGSARINSAKVEGTLLFDDLCRTVKDDGNPNSCGLLKGTVWDLVPGIKDKMYEHQQEAFEFMWKNLAGGIDLDELKSGARSDVIGGCVISHAPGTGKTRLSIIFIQTYMKVFPECRPVIVAPSGMLLTWEEEFRKWNVDLPIHNLNAPDYSGKEDIAFRQLAAKEPRNISFMRLVKLYSWVKSNGILGISYGLFKKLTADNSCDPKLSQVLLEKPGLLVLDEGHTPRNERSLIWKALGKIKTEKRIILSGTPFQNNFGELYNIMCLVKPKFAEKISIRTSKRGQRKAKFISYMEQDILPEKNEGKEIWASLTNHVTDDNAEEIRSILKPFVHIHSGNILNTLPGLRECVIELDPPPHQKDIIEKMEHIGSNVIFENEYKTSLASIHPSLVTYLNLSTEEESLLDKPLLEKQKLNPYIGVKTRFVMEVVRLCEALKEKVLIFSQYIQPLSMIKDQLIKLFNWSEGKEVLQMDGKIRTKYRQSSIDIFNDMESEARVLLASTKACCEGISLTGASRVVLLDVVWNPAVGRQAISRAYRIGQKKFVYTYNLMTSGTGERDKYDRQAKKDHLSKLVFSTEIDFTNVRNSSSQAKEEHSTKLISEDKILEEMTAHDKLKGMFLKIYYPPKGICT
ncbi:SNF2 domain-containing protein CLASSY 4-like [Phoenix dactylifera]|uniref:SNF2 domain-containing protein CLASSY 4-like n=1 Tax=Phoenix dactylifera TaxID=42345 RepID=A0A8B8J6J9_PHODC|nr:SNF2 domain-containing protein CLASSY 4-like [Phoenix dactylifera]